MYGNLLRRRNMKNILYGLFRRTDLSISRGSLNPALFSANTRKKYSAFSFRLWIHRDVMSGVSLSTFFHIVFLASFSSTTYPFSGNPPSLCGGFHSIVAEVFCMSLTVIGPVGLDGLPVKQPS